MEEELKIECEYHGRYCRGELMYVIEPYDEDVNGITRWVWICKYHYDASLFDI